MLTYTIERTVNYHGGTSPKITYTVRRSDGKSFGTYTTLKRAKAELALYAEGM